jgi:hypothetical protein
MNDRAIDSEKKQDSGDCPQEQSRISEGQASGVVALLGGVGSKGWRSRNQQLRLNSSAGKTSSIPSFDSTVRAYVSNLRRKLELYYLTEGIHDEFQIVLPKGDYKIDFALTPILQTPSRQRSFKLPSLVLISTLLVLLILVIWLGAEKIIRDRRDNRYIKKNDRIWHDLFVSNKKTLIVLGDYYFFSMPLDSGRQSYIRDVRINSEEELAAFLESHPQYRTRASKTYHTYLEENIPWSLACILPSFVYHNKEIELKLSSEVQLADLQRYNIVYLGPYKSLRVLSTVTRELNFEYRLDDHRRLDFIDISSNKRFTYTWMTNPETQARNDYAIVLKVSGGNDNTFLFFLSQHDFATSHDNSILLTPRTSKS